LIEKLWGSTDSDVYSDFFSRQANSGIKLVAAHARLSGRDCATDDDVLGIEHILKSKIDFIKSIVSKLPTQPTGPDINTTVGRRRWIQETYSGKTATAAEILNDLHSKGCDRATERTIYRDLEIIGAKSAKHGFWKI
jgi:hypothetical protein